MTNIFIVKRYTFGRQIDRQRAIKDTLNLGVFCQFRPLGEPLIGRLTKRHPASWLSECEECPICVKGHNWHRSSWVYRWRKHNLRTT